MLLFMCRGSASALRLLYPILLWIQRSRLNQLTSADQNPRIHDFGRQKETPEIMRIVTKAAGVLLFTRKSCVAALGVVFWAEAGLAQRELRAANRVRKAVQLSRYNAHCTYGFGELVGSFLLSGTLYSSIKIASICCCGKELCGSCNIDAQL